MNHGEELQQRQIKDGIIEDPREKEKEEHQNVARPIVKNKNMSDDEWNTKKERVDRWVNEAATLLNEGCSKSYIHQRLLTDTDYEDAYRKDNVIFELVCAEAKKVNKNLRKLQTDEKHTATPTTPATRHYTTKSWGFYDATTNTVAEQIEPWLYLCNSDGKLSLANVIVEKDGEGKKERIIARYLVINGSRYHLPLKISKVRDYYYTPSSDRCRLFLEGGIIVRPINVILMDVRNTLLTLFDFAVPRDVELWLLFIVQSWLKPILDEFYFFGIDATKGGGKTTLLEIASLLCRHGYLGGDMSPASLPRLVEDFDLSLFLDEVDQRLGTGEDDTANILRKGQRRGNMYVRVNRNTGLVEQFDVAGTHAYSYRSEIEDAFASRSLTGHTAESKDNRLPIMNVYKKSILQHLQEELFFWYLSSCSELARSLQQVATRLSTGVVSSSECSRQFGSEDINAARTTIYNTIVQNFSAEELQVLQSFQGRNAELAFLLIKEAQLVQLPLTGIIGSALKEKQLTEDAGASIQADVLRDVLHDAYYELRHNENVTKPWQLSDGRYPFCYYTTKSGIHQDLQRRLKEQNLPLVAPKRYTSLLRDVGFLQGDTMCSQRPPERNPCMCLIFAPEILSRIGIVEKSLPSKQDIVNAIQSSDGVATIEALRNLFPVPELQGWLQSLASDGIIHENPKDVWRLT